MYIYIIFFALCLYLIRKIVFLTNLVASTTQNKSQLSETELYDLLLVNRNDQDSILDCISKPEQYNKICDQLETRQKQKITQIRQILSQDSTNPIDLMKLLFQYHHTEQEQERLLLLIQIRSFFSRTNQIKMEKDDLQQLGIKEVSPGNYTIGHET